MSIYIRNIFEKIKIDHNWSFSDKSRKETTYLTHGYHRYPAKFIPQVVSKLLSMYAKKGDFIVDPFGGCGTTLVESKVNGMKSWGVDINPVAVMITKSKITPIDPIDLEQSFIHLKDKINSYSDGMAVEMPKHERIDYWFKPLEKKKLSFILNIINEVKDPVIRNFYYCAFSNSLKNCSIWLQKSNKPTRDLNKTPSDPLVYFLKQTKSMMKGNYEFNSKLTKEGFQNIESTVSCDDARHIPIESDLVDLIITSPPYVTSYEYADLHQLSALWFEYIRDLSEFRKKFIGTSFHDNRDIEVNSVIGTEIVNDLFKVDKKKSKEVANYFSEMNEVFNEMFRLLKKGGKSCIVVGDTAIRKVPILNSQVFVEQMQNIGFKIHNIIKREIPSKNLPSVRDEVTGKFAKITNSNKVLVYPTEFILVMEKI